MKLDELGAHRRTEHISRTLSQRLGDRVDFNRLQESQAQRMLIRVQKLLREYRASPSRHYGERNPDYLRLMMLEQALSARLDEQDIVPGTTTAANVATVPGTLPAADQAKQDALFKAQQAQRKRQMQDQIKQKQKEIQDLQKAMNQPLAVAEQNARKGRLIESEIQQAQVVMASQDMIDRIQGMMEDISEMQFKDLPALTDAIKNDMGADQSTRFQSEAAAALTNLLAAVQAGKGQLEAAQSVLTGQEIQVPGAKASPEIGGVEADLDLDANLPAEPEDEEEPEAAASLGRERR